MSDYLTWLWSRANGLEPVVRPLIAPVYAATPEWVEQPEIEIRTDHRVMERASLAPEEVRSIAEPFRTTDKQAVEPRRTERPALPEPMDVKVPEGEIVPGPVRTASPGPADAAESGMPEPRSTEYLLLMPNHVSDPEPLITERRANAPARQNSHTTALSSKGAVRPLEPLDAEENMPAPQVRVHIGRIDVRATFSPAKPAASRAAGGAVPRMTLDEYLHGRNGGR